MNGALLVGLLLAQAVTPDAPASPDLARIRRALEEPAPPSLVFAPSVSREGSLFRVKIRAFELGPAWKDRSMVPPYVRTWFRLYHHEFLEQADHLSPTPEVFRGATLFPSGIPADPLIRMLVKEIKAARRASQAKQAKDVVARELAAFLACRADPSKPGC